jgi:poly-gamma-glutamate synthesis protein (capsule biosynthesis protein)
MKQKILIYGLVFLVLVVVAGIVFTKPGKLNVKIASGKKMETASKKAVSLPKEPAPENRNINFFFAGDAMLDRYILTVAQKRGAGFLTEKMQDIFSSPNEIVFNLEGPVTKNSSVSKETLIGDKGNMSFTFDADVTKNFLQSTRASAVFIGNNHVLDFGKEGLDDTKNFLIENQMPFFGDAGGENKPLERKIGNAKVAYVAFNQFLGQPAEKIVEEIGELKKTNDFVVLYAHWGVEYARAESEKQKEWAHSFIDAGADLVIGSHPHVVQPVEIYKNKAIFYSLGNFVFDQYFSPETMEGLAVGISVKDDALDFYLSPLSLNHNGSTTLSEGKKKDSLLLWLAENSAVSGGPKEGLKSGHFQIENK